MSTRGKPNSAPFWETKRLHQMNALEWESLCDGCGLCCLIRFEDEETGEIIPTRVSCKLLDQTTCACKDYANRKQHVPDCIKLNPYNIDELTWMPKSCAYRRVYEGRGLPAWHPLLTGDPDSPHAAGASIRGQTVSEAMFEDSDAALDFTAYDLLEDRSDMPLEADADSPCSSPAQRGRGTAERGGGGETGRPSGRDDRDDRDGVGRDASAAAPSTPFGGPPPPLRG